jgi:hypothetical protein
VAADGNHDQDDAEHQPVANSTSDATGRDVSEACSGSRSVVPIDRVTPRLDTM